MNPGRIEYSPDYKPEKPLNITILDDQQSAAVWRSWQESEQAEIRACLEREVIEAAKRWVPKRGQHGLHHTARMCSTCAAERSFYGATSDLLEFESQHETK